MKRKLKTVIIAIMTLCILATSVLSACNPVSPDGEPQDQPPVGEAWVYTSTELQKQAIKNDINKIVLKSTGKFTENVEIVGALV